MYGNTGKQLGGLWLWSCRTEARAHSLWHVEHELHHLPRLLLRVRLLAGLPVAALLGPVLARPHCAVGVAADELVGGGQRAGAGAVVLGAQREEVRSVLKKFCQKEVLRKECSGTASC